MKVPRGFTLIELLVVIAIIGILASIVLTSLSAARQKGKRAAVVAQLGEMSKMFEMDQTLAGSYPDLNNGGGGTGAKSVLLNPTGPGYYTLSRIQQNIESQVGGTLGNGNFFTLCTNPIAPQTAYAIYAKDPNSANLLCRDSNGRSAEYTTWPANEAGGNCRPVACP